MSQLELVFIILSCLVFAYVVLRVFWDWRFFGVMATSLLMRRKLSDAERSELLDEKHTYEDLVQPFGVLNRCVWLTRASINI